MVKRRGYFWHIRFRLNNKEIWASTPSRLKREAETIEKQVKYALRTGDYNALSRDSRAVCLRIFKNRSWKIPDLLINPPVRHEPIDPYIEEELTILRAVEHCIKYPDVSDNPNRERLEQSFMHIIRKFGADYPVSKIGIPEIKQYRKDRVKEGAAPATANKEKSALSKMFQVLVEKGLIATNPARLVSNLSEKNGEREVYISRWDFNLIVERLPEWFRPVAQMAYFTGMRKGEILGLKLGDINLSTRIIYLTAEDTKERRRKRVPIHCELKPILLDAIDGRKAPDELLLVQNGTRFSNGNGRRSWEKAVAGLDFKRPPRFHDLRHTWKTNARRSGMDQEIREAILGHVWRGKSVSERYGRISNDELIQAIEKVTFDHGPSEIWVNGMT